MNGPAVGEIVGGLWRFEALHPEWTEEEDWERSVAWWAVASGQELVLVDPLVADWAALDLLVDACRGCAGIVRTCHWHQRSIAEAATRYRAEVWAKPPPDGTVIHPFDHPVTDRDELVAGLQGLDVERGDELALWLPAGAALLFGDAMVRDGEGELHMCPESWLQPEGGRDRLRVVLGRLAEFPAEHVLVSHGPLVLGHGRGSLRAAVS